MITQKELRQVMKLDPNKEQEVLGSDLATWISTVCAMLEANTRRLWTYRSGYSYTQQVENPCTDTFFRSRLFPVASLTLSEWDATCGGPSFAIAVDPSDYYVVPETGRVMKLRDSPFLQMQIVTVTGGYTPTTAPMDVKRALLTQVHFMTKRLGDAALILKSQGFEKGSTSYADFELHPMFKNVCDRYAVDY